MVHLNWATNLDTETIAYSIERKDSNGDFIEIDWVETLNDYSQTYFYTYKDGSVTNGSYE